MRYFLSILALFLASCQDRPKQAQQPKSDTLTAGAVRLSDFHGLLHHAPQRTEQAVARQAPPAFLLKSECKGSVFRAYLVCNQDVEGSIGSIAITLRAPDIA